MQVIRTLQKSPLGQRRGILHCLRWYTQIWSKVAREKIGALGPATGPKELTFFPVCFDKICINHWKQLKIPRRWGAIAPRNIPGKKRYWWKSMKLWKIFKGLSGVSGAKYQRSANGLEQVLGRAIQDLRTKKNRWYTPNPPPQDKESAYDVIIIGAGTAFQMFSILSEFQI